MTNLKSWGDNGTQLSGVHCLHQVAVLSRLTHPPNGRNVHCRLTYIGDLTLGTKPKRYTCIKTADG